MQNVNKINFKLLILLGVLMMSVTNAWAYWHVPGTHASTGWTSADGNESCMDGSNKVTFYAVAAGTYQFKLVKGSEWGNGNFTNKSSSIITSLCNNCAGNNNDNNSFTINCIADVTFQITNEGSWSCDVSAVASSYFIKYPWGENHAWTFSAAMTACADGTYACTGPYNGTTYDFGRRGYAGGAGALTGQTATVNNEPGTDETCVFNVTTAGALTITRCNKVTATNKIYFDNSVSNFTGNIYLIIGHDKPTKYSCAYKMTQLAGTKLHYVSVGANWTDATYYAIVGNSASSIDAGSWGSSDLSSKQNGGYSAAYTDKWDLDGSNKQYLFTTSSSGNNKALTITYKNTGYSNLNYAQSVTLCTKAYGDDEYAANTSSLTSLNFTTYNLTGVGTVSTQQTNSKNGATGVASGNACQAATTTINVGDAPASWVYDGIYTGMNSGSRVSEDQEFTYYPTAAKSYYVRFHEVHDPSVSVAASSSYLTTTSGLRALKGETITLTATALYNVNSLVYTYEYSTNSGSSWTTIASRSASNTQTFTANSTGDYIFRVTLPDEAGTVNGTTNVHMTEMYRIKVKKNASWTPNKLYVWNKSSEITQYGAFPGSTGKFTNHGQWYEFDLNSDFDSYIVSASDHNTNRTADVNNVTSDGCYAIGGTTGTSCSVSSATCPSAPSLSTLDAGTIRETSAVLGGRVSNIGNDPMTERGYYWSTNSALSSSNLGVGTKVVVSSASTTSTGDFSATKSSLSVNTKYYVIAYATNAYGTGYGTVKNFTTLPTYSVTVAAGSGGEVNTTSVTAGQYQSSGTITATPSTNYAFVNWTASTANITIASATSKSTTVKATSTGTVTANFADQWNIKGNQWDNWNTYKGLPNVSSNTFRQSFTLAAKTTYNFKVVKRADAGGSDIWYGVNNGKTLTRNSNSVTGLEQNGGENEYISFTTDAAGEYTFTYVYNASVGSMSVTVGYPTAYAITLKTKSFYNESATGTVDTNGGTVSAVDNKSATITDGDKVQIGGTVTFTATPKTGYTFAGWYSDASCSTEYEDGTYVDVDDNVLELSNITAAKTVYAKFTENMTTVSLYTIGSGHIEISSEEVTSAKVGKHTTYSVVAVPDAGHYFTGWTKSSGTDYNISSTSSATTTLSGNGGGSTSGQMLTANFARRWVIAGEWAKDGSGNWVLTNDMNVSTVGGKTCAGRQITGLAANTSYNFKLYDRTDANGGGHWVGFATSGQVYDYATHDAVSPADSILVNSYPGNNISLKTAAQGDYYFYYNIYSHKLYVSFPASRQVTMGIRTISDGVTSAYTGGTISAEDERDNVITNGLYIKSGDDITFTASPKAGYIWRGWYNSSGCTGAPVATERVHTDEDVTAVGFTRYALFEEALYTVKVHLNESTERSYKIGVDTHQEITAGSAPDGKIFDRWETTGSATVEDPYASTTTITGATDDASTVTATFKDLPKIYIDMTSATGWNPSKMYVVFYKSGGYFNSDNGTGLSSSYVITPTPLEMTKMGDSKIWYYSYDPTSGVFAGNTITCVTFIDHWFEANYGNFTSATAVYRTDFSSCMNMFVVTDDSGVNKNTSCHYRNTNAISGHDTKGYWRKYEENNSGFYLNNLPGGTVEFTNEDGGNTYTAVANLDANTTYYFYLGGCNGWNWSNNNGTYPFNYNNPTRNLETYTNVSEDQYRCKLKTTAAGYYTFTLTPQNTRNVQVSVAFPVAANDYRAVYNNAASSPTIKRPSNIIKSDQNSGTISLWLNEGTNYISFQKASVAGDGAVSWTACGVQQTVTGVPEAGIYTMTLTKNNTTYTVSTPAKYEGDLYIRTDCAPGKWVDYTENKLTENTFNFNPEDASTYDYYYCKWINDAGTNVRCVIANDYNVAISDTLKTEAILGGGETLPEGANVRFSYNSVTNTLKRSYLTGSSTNVFLNILPDAASTVYQSNGTTDMYNSHTAGATNKFTDLGNWVYELDVKVMPNATAAVTANYNSTQQALIAAETKLVGGTGEDKYSIRLIYNFRTNNLMSAWMPDGDVSSPISLNSDMMIVRRAQNDANQLSFSSTGKLTDVKRAYGVFEFHKADMVDRMSTWNDYGETYSKCMYYFSLPFDVNVSDIFGVGTMGDDWRLQFYNGTKRAEKGWFAGDGTTTFWEDVPADTVLHAYEGYCLMLNRSHFNNGSHAVWNNVTTDAYLYFPSVAPVAALKDNEMEITVPSHECKIDRFFDQDKAEYYDPSTKTWKKGARNHKYVDSHWNLMGTPLFEDATADALTACKVTIGDADSTLNYIYEWVPSTNSLSARQVLNTGFTFKPMYAYMVQYSGKVTFTGASITPASIAARRTSENKQYTIDLLLTKEDRFAGRTYVELRENAVDSFMLNEDMYMMKGSKIGDIYTHADGYELAANVLSINSHIVPVSVDTKSAGTYTISMSSNFSGTVTLVDKHANTRTNLGIEDYEIYLEKGTISDRFLLEIDINQAPTAIDGVEGGSLKDGKAHKFIMNDMLYILKDGVLFDARGNRVK